MKFLLMPRWLQRPAGVVSMGVLSLWLTGAGSVAQARETIDLSWVLQQTLANNEALKAYPFQQRRAEALKLQAGLRPVPTLGVSVENAFGSGEYSSVDRAEATLTLSQTIEMGGKRIERMSLADAGIRLQETEYEMSRLDVLAEASRRYYQLLAVQERQALVARSIKTEQRALKAIAQRARAGAVGQADVSKMDLRLARSMARREQLRAEHRLASTRLAAMWQRQPDFQRAAGALISLPALPDADRVLQSIEQAPALLNQLSLERMQDSRVSLAQANGRSDMTFGVGVKQLEASNDQALMLSFSMPLAFSNPNRGRISAALADRELAVMQTGLARRQLELELLEIQLRLSSYRDQANNLQQQLIPKAETLLADTERGYQQGRYSVLELTDAQAELVILEQALIDIHNNLYLQFLELERITGQPFALIEQGVAL